MNSQTEPEAESISTSPKKRVINRIVELIAESLDVHYSERRNFTALLKSSIEHEITKRGEGLLDEFLHEQLRKMLPRFKRELDLPKDLDIEPGYASHAKMAPVVDAIKSKYVTEEGN